jgi:catechol 2,3-dioxygenase-like lactoylglutathione lyase family enzyme
VESESRSMHLKQLTPMLSVTDLKRTMAFYCDELAFACTGKFGDPDPVWCHLQRDGVRLMFNQPPAAEMDGLPRRAKDFQVFYFYPNDVAQLHAAWKTKGLPVTDLRVTVYQMKEFELRDPDGYWLWFGQDTTEPPTVTE